MSGLWHNASIAQLLQWLAAISLVTFLLSIILIPWLVGRMRKNFFLIIDRRITVRRTRDLKWYTLLLIRNFFGWLLVAAGILMLFLPGQGLITIVLGLLVVSFPGKRRLVSVLIRNEKLQHGLNWLRRKRRQPPFSWPAPRVPKP